jgi:hypothetical protein
MAVLNPSATPEYALLYFGAPKMQDNARRSDWAAFEIERWMDNRKIPRRSESYTRINSSNLPGVSQPPMDGY